MNSTKKKRDTYRTKTKKIVRGGATTTSLQDIVRRITAISPDRRNDFVFKDIVTHVETPLGQLINNTKKYHQTVLIKSLMGDVGSHLLRNGQVYKLTNDTTNNELLKIELNTNVTPSPFAKKKDIHDLAVKKSLLSMSKSLPILDFFKRLDTEKGGTISSYFQKLGNDVTNELQQMIKGNTSAAYDTSTLQNYQLDNKKVENDLKKTIVGINVDANNGVVEPKDKKKVDRLTQFIETKMDMGYEVEIIDDQVVFDFDYLVGINLAIESVAEQFGMPVERRIANYNNQQVSLTSLLNAVLIFPNLQPATQKQRDDFHMNVVTHIGKQIASQEKLRQVVNGFLPDIVVTSSSDLLPSFVFRRYLTNQYLPPLENQTEGHIISDRVHMFV